MPSSSSNSGDDFKYYHYNPSLAAASLFTTLFFVCTVLHTYQLLRTRTWIFIPFIVGGSCEVMGYIGRIVSANETPDWTQGPFIMQTILLLVAPALFAASIYMLLGRVIILTDGERHSLLSKRWLTKAFVAGDVVSFLAQGAGGGILGGSGSKSSKDLGQAVIVAGIGIQVLVFGLFVAVAGVFHYRLIRQPTDRVQNDPDLPWKPHMYALYGTSAIIWIRSVFRLIEFAQGNDGYFLNMEVWLYVFDSVLMFAVMVWFAAVHPSEVHVLLKGGNCKAIRKVIFNHEMKDIGFRSDWKSHSDEAVPQV